MKENNLETMAQLDGHLRTFGSSLEKQRDMFKEHNLGQSAVIEKIKKQPEVTHADMLEYYHENPAKFAILAKARFELLSIYFSRSEGSTEGEKRAAADGQIEEYGKRRLFRHAAGRSGQEILARSQRFQGWAIQLDQQGEPGLRQDRRRPLLLAAPTAERDSGGRTGLSHCTGARADGGPPDSFEEAQKEIKEIIKKERRDAKIKEVLEDLKKGPTIWTIYDEVDEQEAARQDAKPDAVPAVSR